VRETVELALEARQATSFWGSLLWLPGATRDERSKRAEAAELIDFLGLGRYADRFIAELSTGTRRIVELAAVLAVAPRVICLDEPTAGVAQREAEAFGPLIKRVQQELDATLIVVEHDLPLIMAISDRVYCMEAGAIIAEGSPDSIRNDPLVVASYLGTDEHPPEQCRLAPGSGGRKDRRCYDSLLRAVTTWREDGWVLIPGLIGPRRSTPRSPFSGGSRPPSSTTRIPKEMERQLGRPPPARKWVWPPDGPAVGQHRWLAVPFPGSGVLNRLCVHPAIVDFMARALETDDLRIYQARVNAKYQGLTNYEQPMHTDRNHSFLPPLTKPPWLHVESFVYLSDVESGTAPTHLVPLRDSVGRSPTEPLIMPNGDPELYAAERPATGVRGSLLAYRPDVFHRGVDLTDPGAPGSCSTWGTQSAGQDWIGYDSMQSRANSLEEWGTFAEHSTPKELALFGFPPRTRSGTWLIGDGPSLPSSTSPPWRRARRGVSSTEP
jgi:hypothetical protein